MLAEIQACTSSEGVVFKMSVCLKLFASFSSGVKLNMIFNYPSQETTIVSLTKSCLFLFIEPCYP